MKYAFIVCLLSTLLLSASTERKIIAASFPTLDTAEKGLESFNKQLDPQIFDLQYDLGFKIKVRPSGKAYILVLEPFATLEDAKQIKGMLPNKFSDAFINRYTPPTQDTPQAENKKVDIKKLEPIQQEPIEIKQPPIKKQEIPPTIIQSEPIDTSLEKAPKKEQNTSTVPPKISTVLGIEPPVMEEFPPSKPLKKDVVPQQINKVQNQGQVPASNNTMYTPMLLLLVVLCFGLIYYYIRQNRTLQKKVYDLNIFNQQKTATIDNLESSIHQKETYFTTILTSLSEPIDTLYTHIDKENTNAFNALNTLKMSILSYTSLNKKVELDNELFDLNSAINALIQEVDIPLTLDIDSGLPKEIITDRQKFSYIVQTLIEFIKEHSDPSNLYLSLQEVKQKQDFTVIKGLIKVSAEGFEKNTIDLIQHALSMDIANNAHHSKVIQLTIVKRFLQAMKGSIKLNVQSGKVTGFVFDLVVESPEHIESRKYRLPDKSMMNYSVLIADTNILAIGILRKQLEYFHMEVKPCFSWEQTQSSLEDNLFFVDLCLIQMQLLSDEELKQLLNLSEKKNFALVFIVDDKNCEDYKRAEEIEHAQLLVKPYTQDSLLALLKDIYEDSKKSSTLNIE